MFGSSSRMLERLEDNLELAIFQTAWDPREIQQQMTRLQRTLRQEREARLADARLMAKVESYTVHDEDEDDELTFEGEDSSSLFESALERRHGRRKGAKK
jgi:hypothetical protein